MENLNHNRVKRFVIHRNCFSKFDYVSFCIALFHHNVPVGVEVSPIPLPLDLCWDNDVNSQLRELVIEARIVHFSMMTVKGIKDS